MPHGTHDDSLLPHRPVLRSEVVTFLVRHPGHRAQPLRLVDGTVGAGGHARAILQALTVAGIDLAQVRYLGVDRDRRALRLAYENLVEIPARVVLAHGRLRDLRRLASEANFPEADGVLLDLGVSSMQLADRERGFAFDGDLDMRMDPDTDVVTAMDLVHQLDEPALTRLLREGGEGRYARRIARGIVTAREREPITGARQLATVVARSVPRRHRHGRTHVATRTFQALRIAVNDELREAEAGLRAGLELLAPGGRLVVISFHSLEDRIAKTLLREAAEHGTIRLLTRRVVTPTEEELSRNRRARSARLRAAERPGQEDAA
jgi:16S rRNA (cytosine1402-N4)-methyltransferase